MKQSDKELFKSGFMAGMEAAGRVTRSQIESACEKSLFDYQVSRRKPLGEKTAMLLDLFKEKKVVKTKEGVKAMGGTEKFWHRLVTLKRQGKVVRAGYGEWRLNDGY